MRSSIRAVHFHTAFGALTENWIAGQIAGLDGQLAGIYSQAEARDDRCPYERMRCFQRDVNGIARLLNRFAGRFIHRYPQYLFWLIRDRANLVHAHFGPNGCYMWPFTRLLGIPLVTSFYGYDAYTLPRQNPRSAGMYRRLFRHGQLFLAEGSAMRNKLIELGCPEDKVVIHHIGIDSTRVHFHPRSPGPDVRLLVCGRFVEKKGVPYAVEALKLVRHATGKNVRLTIVGDSDRNGAMTVEKKKILDTIRLCGVGEAVSLVGFISRERLSEVMHEHHILVVPSVHARDGDAEGGFPVTITEALASGMPVVAFDHCDIREILKGGACGMLAPEGDARALAECLGHLIRHPEIWQGMGHAGRTHVAEQYDVYVLNRRLCDLYRQLL